MLAKNLRTFLADVSEQLPGSLYEVDRAVDPKFELTAFVAKFAARGESPGIIFRNVTGSEMPCAINLLGSYDRVALALGCDPAAIGEFFGTRLARGVEPRTVSREAAPVKDVALRGTAVDLRRLPLPWHNELDGGAFITGGTMITRDRETGAYNAGIYRHQLFGERELRSRLQQNPRRWLYLSAIRRTRRDRPGCDPQYGHHPAYLMAAVARLPGVGGEYEAAGSLLERASRPREVRDQRPARAGGSRDRHRRVDGSARAACGRPIRRMAGALSRGQGLVPRLLRVSAVTHRQQLDLPVDHAVSTRARVDEQSAHRQYFSRRQSGCAQRTQRELPGPQPDALSR